jgi:hypothetical protein
MKEFVRDDRILITRLDKLRSKYFEIIKDNPSDNNLEQTREGKMYIKITNWIAFILLIHKEEKNIDIERK